MREDLIRYTELRAQEHELAYTHDTPPEQLLEQVGHHERGLFASIAPQDFPDVCFGKSWGGYFDRDCTVCVIQTACLQKFSASTLRQAEHDEKTADPYVLYRPLAVPPSAVLLAQLYNEQVEGQAPPHPHRPYTRLKGRRRPVPDVAARRRPSLPWRQDAFACLLGAQAAHAPFPPPLPPASQRLGLMLPDTYVLLRYSCLEKRRPPAFGSKAWQDRLARERAKLPLLAQMPIGTVLRRVHKGELVEVHVLADHYLWRGMRYPTLYDVVCAVCGLVEYARPAGEKRPHGTRRMANWSVPKFFVHSFAAFQAHLEGRPPPKRSRTGPTKYAMRHAAKPAEQNVRGA